MQGSKFIDSGGGFLIEEALALEETIAAEQPIPETEAIELPVTYEECIDCGAKFADSHLFNNFAYSVCDRCW